MTSFALSSSTQFFSCSHENPATQLDTRDEYCVECKLLQEGSSVEHALNLHETDRSEQESEPAQSSYIPNEKGFNHQWTNRDGEYLEGVYDITNRLPSWLYLGKHVFPMFKQDELNAYLALPSTDTICIVCHLQVNRFVGCQQCITPSQSLYNEIRRVMLL
jgi:hypothetical protein